MRAVATWIVRAVLAAAAVCGAATCIHAAFHGADAANRDDDSATVHSPRIEPLAVSPRKPPLDAGLDGGGAALPPIPDAKVPLTDSAVTPMTAM
jgi:hypothetical protein